MNIFNEMPNELVFTASKRVLAIKANDLVHRFIDLFRVSADISYYLFKLSCIPDSAKLRHWLAVARSMIRSRSLGLDPEPQFISHFIVDALDPSRLAELHAIRGVELLIDDAIINKSEITVYLPDIIVPPKFNFWGIGTIVNELSEKGIDIKVQNNGHVIARFGRKEFLIQNESESDARFLFEKDLIITTEHGQTVIASNIQGLGDAYHSSAPIVRTGHALMEWIHVLNKSINDLASLDRSVAAGCLELSKAICPLHCGSTSFGSSSPADIIGLVFLPGVLNHLDVMECLLHESLHQKLYHAEEGASLFHRESGDEEIYYSPWRPDARPLRMLVHGAFVFTGVAQMWKMIAQRETDPSLRDEALFHVHYRSSQVMRALEVVHKYGQPTSFGSKIVDLINDETRSTVSGLKFPNYYANASEARLQSHFEAHSTFVH